jgi:inward rectifier potassium channel
MNKETSRTSTAPTNTDTGLGTEAGRIGGRFINKDGSFNLKKTGLPLFKRASIYSYLLDEYWGRLILIIFASYIAANVVFTLLYLAVGFDQLTGFVNTTLAGKIREVFYFSTQTFTTVGYGRINPVGDGADAISSVETITGWLFFAFVTGLVYGRFTRPRAYISFSDKMLISPYRNGKGLMFRMAPYKTRHHLTNTTCVVNLAYVSGPQREFKFYQLKLERSRIDMFNMNWTVVHPIDADSPLATLTPEDLHNGEMEIYVQVSGFDSIYSNQVMKRTSYTFDEVVWGGKFKPMYRESDGGGTTVLEMDKLHEYEVVNVE